MMLSHAGGSYQVLELQRDFSALLRHSAVFEHVSKLIRLTDSHQELRLGQQRLGLHAVLYRRRCQRGKVHMRCNVLLARRLISICGGGVLPVSTRAISEENDHSEKKGWERSSAREHCAQYCARPSYSELLGDSIVE